MRKTNNTSVHIGKGKYSTINNTLCQDNLRVKSMGKRLSRSTLIKFISCIRTIKACQSPKPLL